MIIAGAGGHAKEILGVLTKDNFEGEVFLFDNINPEAPEKIFEKFHVLRTFDNVLERLKKDPRFILGVGVPKYRKELFEKFDKMGGKLTSIVSAHSYVGQYNVTLADGLNIMPQAVITENVRIGKGTLVHVHASIHHDCTIGEFCEILPGSKVLGNVILGDMCSIGSGAVVLPKVKIGCNVTIGAGAVVTKNVPDGKTLVGIPARVISSIS